MTSSAPQIRLFPQPAAPTVSRLDTPPPEGQLLKWIGNKRRVASRIVDTFPDSFGTYYEPFLGSGAVLGALAPRRAVASDVMAPLMEIWTTLAEDPDLLVEWYSSRWTAFMAAGKKDGYASVRDAYNRSPNGADLLFLSRSSYAGVMRFRKSDGHMSTPVGAHWPIHPDKFARWVLSWSRRTSGTEFRCADFEIALESVQSGDLVYCDPPYQHSQPILYGAQSFGLDRLLGVLKRCKERGAFVALSIDGSKASGRTQLPVDVPRGLFVRDIPVKVGRSMLLRLRFGGSVAEEVVSDRLLLSW